MAVVAQPVDVTQGIPQAEREVAQSSRALLNPAVWPLDAYVGHWLGGVERYLGDTRARPAGAAAVEAAHAAVAMQVEDVVPGRVREAEDLHCALRGEHPPWSTVA